MQRSESIEKLAAALVRVQAELKPVEKNAENPAFKRAGKATRYVDLTALCEAVFPLLTKNGLAVAQGGDGPILETMLVHESGQWISTSLPLHVGSKPQEMASAITYARRYALAAIVGAAPEGDDDDGNAASHTVTPPAQSAPAPTPAQPSRFEVDLNGELKRLGFTVYKAAIREFLPDMPEGYDLTDLPTINKKNLVAFLRSKPTPD